MTPVMRYKDIEIVPTEGNHIPDFWKILQSYPDFFCDDAGVKTEDDFVKWFKEHSIDSLTAIKDNQIIGAGYLDDIYFFATDPLASINIFIKKRSISPKDTAPMMKVALPYFFQKHNLKMIYGITRINNRACLNLLKMIGLKITGTLKKHKKVKGVLTDYVMSSILREQVI